MKKIDGWEWIMVVQTLTYGTRLHPSPAESDLLDRTCTAYLSC